MRPSEQVEHHRHAENRQRARQGEKGKPVQNTRISGLPALNCRCRERRASEASLRLPRTDLHTATPDLKPYDGCSSSRGLRKCFRRKQGRCRPGNYFGSRWALPRPVHLSGSGKVAPFAEDTRGAARRLIRATFVGMGSGDKVCPPATDPGVRTGPNIRPCRTAGRKRWSRARAVRFGPVASAGRVGSDSRHRRHALEIRGPGMDSDPHRMAACRCPFGNAVPAPSAPPRHSQPAGPRRLSRVPPLPIGGPFAATKPKPSSRTFRGRAPATRPTSPTPINACG